MFEARDAQLAASFSLKSRSASTLKKVVNENCPEPPDPESIHQPILVNLKRKESNRYKGPHQPQSPSSAARLTPTKDTQNPPPPELSNSLDIRIISTASFAQIM
ncbi:hypothetical protein C0995_004526 [Termitomyces sp. Mi166|nr:hypothetical protein C0995_004526 [Termitomyces sp. Mi166\